MLLLAADTAPMVTPDKDGLTPLQYAAYFGQEGTVEMLLQTDTPQTIDTNISSFSPLHCALVSGHEQCLQLLLAHSDTAVNAADSAGFSPLHIAVAKNLLNSTNLTVEDDAIENAFDKETNVEIDAEDKIQNNILMRLEEDKCCVLVRKEISHKE